MRAEGVSFRHAVELLRADLVPVGSGPSPKRASTRHLPAPVAAGADDAELLAQVVAFYPAALTSSPEALAYLARRRIDHPEAVSRFRLGLSDRTLGYRLPEPTRLADRLASRRATEARTLPLSDASGRTDSTPRSARD